MRQLDGQGLPAYGMQPSGMLRIRLGQQERYVWPVHLPGWLAAGWRVAEPAAQHNADGTEALFPVGVIAENAALSPAAPPPPADTPDTPAATTRGRRGRRRKEEASPADNEPAVVPAQDSTPPEQPLADSDTTGDAAESGPSDSWSDRTAEEPAALSSDSSAEAALAVDPEPAPEPEPEPVLTALPDDLFDDPLT